MFYSIAFFLLLLITFLNVTGAVHALPRQSSLEHIKANYSEQAGIRVNNLLPIQEVVNETSNLLVNTTEFTKDIIDTVLNEDNVLSPLLSNDMIKSIKKNSVLETTIVDYLEDVKKGNKYPKLTGTELEKHILDDIHKIIEEKILEDLKEVDLTNELDPKTTPILKKPLIKDLIKTEGKDDTNNSKIKDKDVSDGEKKVVEKDKINKNEVPENPQKDNQGIDDTQYEEISLKEVNSKEARSKEVETEDKKSISENEEIHEVEEDIKRDETGGMQGDEMEIKIELLEERTGQFPSQDLMGGFVIKTPLISQGKAFDLTSVQRETATQSSTRLGSIKLDQVRMEELKLYRNFEGKTPFHIQIVGNGRVEVNGPISRRDLRVDVSEMYVEKLTARMLFGKIPITLKRQWYMDVEKELLPNLASLVKANIDGEQFYFNTHYLYADDITIHKMNLSIQPGFETLYIK